MEKGWFLMLDFPTQFDTNEWCIILLTLFNIILFRLPKRFPNAITVLIILLSISIAKTIDHTIAVFPVDLYDLNDTKRYELFDLLLYACYPPFGYLCVYFYIRLKKSGLFVLLYIIIWAFFAVIFEYFLVKIHVFKYNGWSIFYSFPTYLIVIFIYLIFFKFVLNFYDKTISREN
jgi:hypothetical protein